MAKFHCEGRTHSLCVAVTPGTCPCPEGDGKQVLCTVSGIRRPRDFSPRIIWGFSSCVWLTGNRWPKQQQQINTFSLSCLQVTGHQVRKRQWPLVHTSLTTVPVHCLEWASRLHLRRRDQGRAQWTPCLGCGSESPRRPKHVNAQDWQVDRARTQIYSRVL